MTSAIPRRLAASLAALALAASPLRAATPRDLAQDERRGGHTLSRHVGLSDDDLRERLRRERRIGAASTWPDRQVAERVVGEALARSAARVRSWSSGGGPRPNLVLDYRGRASEVIGRSLRRGRARAEPCTDAVIVLKWRSPDYFVLTAYPEVRR